MRWSRAVESIGSRNFGNFPNYLLSGRPCATRGCPPEKFVMAPDGPNHLPLFLKKLVICLFHQTLNVVIQMWARNIDSEAKLFNMDYKGR